MLMTTLGGGAPPASAATDSVLLSRDGVHYSTSLDGGLFDGAAVLVPGQSMSVDLWVKNPTATPGSIRVSVHSLSSSSAGFANGVTLGAANSTSFATSSIETLADLHPCDVLTSVPTIGANEAVRVTLTLTMSDLIGRVAQADHAGLDLLVSIKDAAAGPFAPSACNDDGVLVATGNGHFTTVAYTGTELPVPLIVAAGLMLGVGVFLVSRRRRREDRD
ncbi:MAG: cell wall anchor protein [Microbacteriaceae bacterium]|jgi:LPXTG-motif cell wall-anchored protein|nr:cell wall anchor protein [Microbacteriaceae bacterium]